MGARNKVLAAKSEQNGEEEDFEYFSRLRRAPTIPPATQAKIALSIALKRIPHFQYSCGERINSADTCLGPVYRKLATPFCVVSHPSWLAQLSEN